MNTSRRKRIGVDFGSGGRCLWEETSGGPELPAAGAPKTDSKAAPAEKTAVKSDTKSAGTVTPVVKPLPAPVADSKGGESKPPADPKK